MEITSWSHVERLFLASADLDAAERARFLDQACAGDAGLRAEVESLVEADRKAAAGLAAAVGYAAAELLEDESGDADAMNGLRLGAYRVVRQIGRGGMGAVYLATRDDQQYSKQVAIKIVKRGMDTADVLGRFRHERQILANLDHPYIAKLIDGGALPDGRPFFVMDYVEGAPLDVFCRERAPNLKQRLQLFLKICEAVSHAHRNLIVHRDLKPGNILVDAGGSPKLLDFGVAKLLTPGAAYSATLTTMNRPFTPEYASPEQVKGAAITTATDVYALGAILYELLTGERAQKINTASPLEIDRAICETLVGRPSTRIKGIDSDLDNIVLMAMRKEPERRYPSVDQLAEDVRRYLEARPVMARQDSFRYRAGKFVARNRAGIAAAVLFAAVLIAGAATSTVQARRANRERAAADAQRRIAEANQMRAMSEQLAAEAAALEAGKQRANAEEQRRQADLQKTVAETEKRLADRRFEQVRQLAGKFLLDFHDAIAALPGSTPARKMVVETGLQYFDSLVREANGNRDLLEEIARGYDRLGDVQGNAYYANLGDSDGALASYRKAIAIRQKVKDDSPRFLSERIAGQVRIAQMLALKGDPTGATRTIREAVLWGETAPAAAREVREALAGAYRAMGDMYFRGGGYDRSIEPYGKLLALWTEMAKERKDPLTERIGVSLGNSKLGDALMRLYRGSEAVGHLRTAAAIDRELAEANPNSAPRLRQLYSDLAVLSVLFRRSPELAAEGEAEKAAEEAASMAEREYTSDPTNSTSLFDVMVAQTLVGDWYRDHGDPEASVPHYRKAVDAVEKFASGKPPAQLTDDSLVYAHQRLAAGMGLSGQLDGALDHVRKGEEYLLRMEARNPGSINNASRRGDLASTRGEAYANREMWKEAIADFARASALLDELHKRNPENGGHLEELAHVRSRLADCQAAAGDWAAASSTIALSLGNFGEIAASRPLRKDEEALRTASQGKLDMWRARVPR